MSGIIEQVTLMMTQSTGFSHLTGGMVIMWVVCAVLFYLAIVKDFEPLLLLPIAFGALLANVPTEGVLNEPFVDGLVNVPGGLYYYISQGIHLELFPPIIFLGVGALTDFGPLIANPRTLLLGAAAQLGISLAGVDLSRGVLLGAMPDGPASESPLAAAALSALLGLDGSVTRPAGPVEPVSGSGASVEIASHLQAWIDRLMSDRDGPLQPAA